MKSNIFLFILAFMAGCSSIQVTYDYDKSADFTKYKTYAYSEDAIKLGVNELDRERFFKAIDAEMAARGISKSDNPDALIDLQIKAQQRQEATATNTGGYYGRYGYAGGMGTTQISYQTYVDGTLFINLVDKATEKVVWQGRGTKTIDENASPQKKDSNVKYVISSIYYNFPIKPVRK